MRHQHNTARDKRHRRQNIEFGYRIARGVTLLVARLLLPQKQLRKEYFCHMQRRRKEEVELLQTVKA